MKGRNLSYFFILLLCLNQSCKHKKTTQPEIESDGIPGEIMVVAKEDELSDVEAIFSDHFQIQDPNLRIAEKSESGKFENKYNFYFIRHKAYEGTEKLAPNILVWNNAASFSDDLEYLTPFKTIKTTGVEMLFYKNVWAKHQLVARIKLNNTELTEAEYKSAAKECLHYFYTHEILPGNLQPNAYTDSINELLSGNYGFKLSIPSQFRLEMRNKEIVWLRQETTRFYRDIFVNIFSDSQTIENKEVAIENRNAFCKKYLKNDEGTLVLVSNSHIFPSTFVPENKEGSIHFSTLRGWYQEEGTYRRGPFIRAYFHDVAHKRYIAVDQFIYAPDMPRAMFYHTAEIIARSFTLEK